MPPQPTRAKLNMGRFLRVCGAADSVTSGAAFVKAACYHSAIMSQQKTQTSQKNYSVAQLDEIDAVKCPCGFSRRAFATPDNPVATIHMVDIQTDARTHYHKKLTEIYLILDGEGYVELDGELIPVKPLTSILIKPGCRH